MKSKIKYNKFIKIIKIRIMIIKNKFYKYKNLF